MAKEEIADHNIAQNDRHNGFGEAGMAAVGVGGAFPGGSLTGLCIAEMAFLGAGRFRADDLAERRDLVGVRGKFMEGFIKYGNADVGQCIKILQQNRKLGEVETGNHIWILQNWGEQNQSKKNKVLYKNILPQNTINATEIIKDSDIEAMKKTEQFMKENQMIEQEVDIEGLIMK